MNFLLYAIAVILYYTNIYFIFFFCLNGGLIMPESCYCLHTI